MRSFRGAAVGGAGGRPAVRERRLSVVAPAFLSVTTLPLLLRTDRELARLDELVFVLHAVAAGLPVAAEDLVPAVRYGLVHAQRQGSGQADSSWSCGCWPSCTGRSPSPLD